MSYYKDKTEIFNYIHEGNLRPRQMLYMLFVDRFEISRATAKELFYTILFGGNVKRINMLDGVSDFTEEDLAFAQWMINTTYLAEIEKSI